MKAWEWLDSPDKWCKHDYAQDKDGDMVVIHSKRAVKYCLLGVLSFLYGDYSNKKFIEAMNKLRKVYDKKQYSKTNLYSWNDKPERTFEEVRNLLKEADV